MDGTCCNKDTSKTCPRLAGMNPTVIWIVQRLAMVILAYLGLPPADPKSTDKNPALTFCLKALCKFIQKMTFEKHIKNQTLGYVIDLFVEWFLDGFVDVYNSFEILGTIKKPEKECGDVMSCQKDADCSRDGTCNTIGGNCIYTYCILQCLLKTVITVLVDNIK